MKEIDVLIIGQGIVGTCLAFECHRLGKSFLVIDNGQPNSSKVSSGIINPITGRKFLLSWKYELLHEQLKESYQYMEKVLSGSFLLPTRIIRLLPDIRAENDWALKRDEYTEYLSSDTNNPYLDFLPDGNDQFIFIKGYRLQIQELLIRAKDFFQENDSFRVGQVDYDGIVNGNDAVVYKNIKATSLVFCQGWQAIHNPYFENHELKPNKGEVLHLKIKNLSAEDILKYSNFLVPIDNRTHWFGSQNAWQFQDENPTENAKEQLVSRLTNDYNFEYQVTDHLAAIRPSTQDRRPRVLQHPTHSNLFSINGMGTKGMSLAPYVVRGFVDEFILE